MIHAFLFLPTSTALLPPQSDADLLYLPTEHPREQQIHTGQDLHHVQDLHDDIAHGHDPSRHVHDHVHHLEDGEVEEIVLDVTVVEDEEEVQATAVTAAAVGAGAGREEAVVGAERTN